jgi:hypothetical protein
MARGDIGSSVGELSIKQKSHKKRDWVPWLKIRRIALGRVNWIGIWMSPRRVNSSQSEDDYVTPVF